MPRITITLDQDTADALAARIDEAAPSLEEVAGQVLYQIACQSDENVGYRRPCTCGWLKKCADDPMIPVHFDPQTNEYWITDDPAKFSMVIHYCFSCGGAAPRSKRHALFVHVPMEEKSRLSDLCAGIKTFDDAIKRLGPPDADMPGGMMMEVKDGTDQEKMIVLRTIMYTGLSETAVVHFTERQDRNGVSLMFLAKSVEEAQRAD